jgi:hypothetical protein
MVKNISAGIVVNFEGPKEGFGSGRVVCRSDSRSCAIGVALGDDISYSVTDGVEIGLGEDFEGLTYKLDGTLRLDRSRHREREST